MQDMDSAPTHKTSRPGHSLFQMKATLLHDCMMHSKVSIGRSGIFGGYIQHPTSNTVKHSLGLELAKEVET
jgi:hypothetical protein